MNLTAEKNSHSQPQLVISKSAIEHNISFFKNKVDPSTQLMLMVKANAYGHGAVEMARLIEQNNWCNYLAVANNLEGIELRKAGIRLPIMILNPSPYEWRTMVENCLEPEIHSLKLLDSFTSFLLADEEIQSSDYPIHLKFNTGMNRLGIDIAELEGLKKYLNKALPFKIKSVLTHLSSAHLSDEDEFTSTQLNEFEQILERLHSYLPQDLLIHCLNSFGIQRKTKYQYQMVRLGIGLYGGITINEENALSPIAQFKTEVCSVRRVKKGSSISYSRSGKLKKDSNIATLSLGYADGFPRKLGNGNWEIEVKGKLYPTIGVGCMDFCMIDLDNDEIEENTTAIIFGGMKSIFDYAEALETIPYEVMTNIGRRVRRVFTS